MEIPMLVAAGIAGAGTIFFGMEGDIMLSSIFGGGTIFFFGATILLGMQAQSK